MKTSRREFLTKSGCALGMAAIATQIEHFGMMSVLAQTVDDRNAPSVPGDYRALVCIFMQGRKRRQQLPLFQITATRV